MPALCGTFIPLFPLNVQQRRRFFYPSPAAFSPPFRLNAPAPVLSGLASCLPSALPLHVPRLPLPLGDLSPVRFVVRCARVLPPAASPLSLPSVAAAAPRFRPFYNRTNAPSGMPGFYWPVRMPW